MTAAEKERALTEFMRRDAAGEKIDRRCSKRSSRPRTRVRPPGSRSAKPLLRLDLKDQNGRTHTLKSLMGRKGVLLVFHPQRRLVTLLSGAARRAAAFRSRVGAERARGWRR